MDQVLRDQVLESCAEIKRTVGVIEAEAKLELNLDEVWHLRLLVLEQMRKRMEKLW